MRHVKRQRDRSRCYLGIEYLDRRVRDSCDIVRNKQHSLELVQVYEIHALYVLCRDLVVRKPNHS